LFGAWREGKGFGPGCADSKRGGKSRGKTTFLVDLYPPHLSFLFFSVSTSLLSRFILIIPVYLVQQELTLLLLSTPLFLARISFRPFLLPPSFTSRPSPALTRPPSDFYSRSSPLPPPSLSGYLFSGKSFRSFSIWSEKRALAYHTPSIFLSPSPSSLLPSRCLLPFK